MQNKIVRIVLFFISLILLVLSIFSMGQDISYFTTRAEATARIESVNDLGSQEPYRVLLKYFNRYIDKEVSCDILLKKSHRLKINEISKGYANIYYSKYMPCALYFVGVNTPTLGVFFINGIMIMLMVLAVLAFKDGFKKV
jgi:hypothetical protein